MVRHWTYILFGRLLVYLIIVLNFAAAELKEVKCNGLRIVVKDTVVSSFIDDSDVLELITKGYGDIVNKNITEINKDSIEQILIKNSAIKSAQVYYSLDGYLHAEIKQRKPVLRVISNESGYYVDEEGKIMPLSRKYSSRVVVATGNISQDYAQEELYPFAMYLKEDKFWDAFIEQIVVKGKNNVSLIPKTGNFSIVMGSLENAEKKMENLRLFLKEGITKRGWNAYKEINLKFDNQIVCVKR